MFLLRLEQILEPLFNLLGRVRQKIFILMAYIRYRNGRFNQYRQMFILFFATEDCDAMTVSDNQNIAVPLAVVLAGGGDPQDS